MKLLFCFLAVIFIAKSSSKINLKHVVAIGNIKDYKKLLKTNKNVLTLYAKDGKVYYNYFCIWLQIIKLFSTLS